MQTHIKILAWLYIVGGALELLGALVIFIVVTGAGALSGEPGVFIVASGIATAVAGFLLVLSLPEIIGGIGLLKRKSWARILVLILGVLNLLKVPYGTILGIYTFWVLLKDESVRRFKAQPA